MFKGLAVAPVEQLPFLDSKAVYFAAHPQLKDRKRWYFKHYVYYKARLRLNIRIRRLKRIACRSNVPSWLSFALLVYADLISGKKARFKDIYQFIGLPGEGKTLSMVAHIDRAREKHPDLVIATNFHYVFEDYSINHWMDIIEITLNANRMKRPVIIAVDEIQNTFDATEWRNFPTALYALLSFNRKLNLQFLCSAQIYERIPSKIRNLANYTVICKNVFKLDRYFINYYFEKNDYESSFTGKRAKAQFVKDFVATDELYSRYDTFEQIKAIKGKATDEKAAMQKAYDLLFSREQDEDNENIKGAVQH